MICVRWLEYPWSFLRNRFKLFEKKLYIFLGHFISPKHQLFNLFFDWVIEFLLTICCNEMTNFIKLQWFLIFQERTEKIKQILENQVAYVQNVIKPQILSHFIAEHVCIKIECFDSLFSMWLTPILSCLI